MLAILFISASWTIIVCIQGYLWWKGGRTYNILHMERDSGGGNRNQPSMLSEVQTNAKYFIETNWWRICGNFALSWTRSLHDMSFDKVMFFYMALFLVWARSTPNVWICVNKTVLWFASTSWKIFVSLNVGAKKILLSYFSFSLLFLHPFCSTLHSL